MLVCCLCDKWVNMHQTNSIQFYVGMAFEYLEMTLLFWRVH